MALIIGNYEADYRAKTIHLGSSGPPLNTTAGDATFKRVTIGTDTVFASPIAGGVLQLFGTQTDTAAGAAAFVLAFPTVAPVAASSAEFRSLYFLNLLVNTTAGATIAIARGGYFENRYRGSENVAQLTGIYAGGVVIDSSSSAAPGTIAIGESFSTKPYVRPSGSRTIAITDLYGYRSEAINHAGATVGTFRHLAVEDPTSSTFTTQVGLDIPVLTRASENIGVRNASNYRGTGYLSIIGTGAAPLNTVSGAATFSTLTVGTDSARGATTGYFANISGTVTDTASGAKIGMAVGLTVNPAGASASEFRAFVMSNVTPAGNAQNFSQIHEGIFSFNELDGSGNSTGVAFGGLIGVLGIGYIVASSGADNGGTISRAAGLVGLGFNTATAATGKTLSAGVGVLAPNPSAIGSLAVTEYVGMEIEALTRLSVGTGRIGFRNADTTQFKPTAQQSIAVSAAIVASATVVQVSTTTAANMTATPTVADGVDGQIIIIVNTGANTFTLQDQGTLAGSNLRLSAAGVALATRDSIMCMYSLSVGDWIQIGQTNVL